MGVSELFPDRQAVDPDEVLPVFAPDRMVAGDADLGEVVPFGIGDR